MSGEGQPPQQDRPEINAPEPASRVSGEAASGAPEGTPPGDTAVPTNQPAAAGANVPLLDSSVVTQPLLQYLLADDAKLAEDPQVVLLARPVIIDINVNVPSGRAAARRQIEALIARVTRDRTGALDTHRHRQSQRYVFARLTAPEIRDLIRQDREEHLTRQGDAATGQGRPRGAIFRIWLDFEVKSLTYKSVSTVKADAAHIAYAALGDGIVWAVLDSGIDARHPHFQLHKNLKLDPPLRARNFVGTRDAEAKKDDYGHGTHVAGIIAGEQVARPAQRGTPAQKIQVYERQRDENDEVTYHAKSIDVIGGMAPKCKLLSFKVLDENGDGRVSYLISALEMIEEINDHGNHIRIHGVNLSVGNTFDPEWFACGKSPLCDAVNRLVRSGVVVVTAAGNTGYGFVTVDQRPEVWPAGLGLTINDPGNAELAITVGSTHREAPHTYGVSYFSSKGPTGDGRLKPDLVAPGEKIISCAAGKKAAVAREQSGAACDYVEDSGTSMAAPHVSGVIAAFLSMRREFIGEAIEVKRIFLDSATDLRRDRYFQGRGLVDLIRAIQSV